jgi:Ser/Thr protein kinase RdoA (MazF antagonist)
MTAEAGLRGTLEGFLGAPISFVQLKHKPGRRRTLRAVGSRRSAIVKLYESERASTVAARTLALSAGPPEPVVPRLLRCDPARRIVVLSYVPGTPLRDALLAHDGDSCARAGLALGAWHEFWRGREPESLRRHTSERELEILDARAASLAPPLADGVRALARGLGADWPCTTVVHRDLYEDQVLVGERIGLIDLDDAAIGPPELDLGNLLAHVELLGLRAGEELEPVTERLLDGYLRSGGRLDPDLLDRCRRLSLLRLTAIHEEPRLLERVAAAARS